MRPNPYYLRALTLPWQALIAACICSLVTPVLAQDTDGDGLPDAWEIRYGLNPLVSDKYETGDGSDGPLDVPIGTTQTLSPLSTNVVGANLAGATVLGVSDSSGFASNDLVLLWIAQDAEPVAASNVAGQYQICRLAGKGVGSLTLLKPLNAAYNSGAGKVILAQKIPEYTSVNVNGNLYPPTWNGTNGGVLAFCAKYLEVGSTGHIHADGKGFRGGADYAQTDVDGFQGESHLGGYGARTVNAIGGGGGGGGRSYWYSGNGGGGGGYGTTGSIGGYMPSNTQDRPTSLLGGGGGAATGNANLSGILPGSGGGSGGQDGNDAGDDVQAGGAGGNGGGVVLIVSSSVVNSGLISCAGGSGGNALATERGGGGGGSGGSVYLVARYSGSGVLNAAGGTPGVGQYTQITGGSGGAGRIRADLQSGAIITDSTPPVGFNGTFADAFSTTGLALETYSDSDQDGLDLLGEAQADTNPFQADTDSDGMPDGWEVNNGTNPNAADATTDTDSDGLANIQELQLGTRANLDDTDGDGLKDGVEAASSGTNPLIADSDSDGMPDKWEVDNGLDPRRNDRDEDNDFDFLTNWEEYSAGLNPANTDSDGNRVTDYKQLRGKTSWDALYDRTDRLLGVRHERGASFGYEYDGNSNLIRQVKLGRDGDNDGLSDLWEFSHGLDPKSSNGANGMAGDLDGDGWTNQQEQLANSDPSSATDKPGINGTILGVLAVPFVPAEFISAAGQLDGSGSQELLVGADGNPGSVTNFVRLFTEGGTGWQGEDIQIGAYGVTSAVIGQLPGKQGAIYLGLRKPGGVGKVVELTRNGAGSWQTRTIVEGTGEAAFVLGLRPDASLGDLVFSGSTRFGPDGALYRAVPNGENWDVSLLEREASHRGNGLVASMSSSDQAIRLLDQGGIQVSEPKSTTQNLEEFNDGTIAGTWATGGHNDAGGSWSVQETGGNFRFAVTWTTSGSNNDSDAWAESNLLWPGDWQAIQISIPSSAHSNSSYGGGDAYVQVGDVTVYSNGTNATRQNVLVQIIRNDQLIYFRRQINGAAWEAWSSGTLSSSNPSKLRFGVWGQEPNGGSASLNVDYVRYLSPAQILAAGASADFTSPTAAYSGATNAWYFQTPSVVNWREAQLLAHSLGGSLATLDSADTNTWLQGKFSGDFWVGYFRNSLTSPWQWVSNSRNSFTPIPWSGGQPSTSADQVYAFSNAGQWSSATGTELKSGIIELKSAVPQVKPTVVSEPTSINRLQIPSRSLTVGRFNASASSESSVVEAFVEDRTPLGVVNDGDEIVISELVLGSNPATQRTLTLRTLTGSGLSSHYGLAAVRNRSGTSEFLVTAESDGQVFAWLPPAPGSPLERKTLSVEHVGYAWHGLERIPLGGGVDGLLGLRVASATPQSVDLVYWDSSDLSFSTPPVIQQSPPTARLVTIFSGGGTTAPLSVRLWDSEGNLARVGFQFKNPTSGLWQDATVPLVNGAPPLSGFHLAAGPAGVTHAAAWNAARDLGSAYRGNVLLRVQGSDNSGSGAWSEPFAYTIVGTVDTDNDGMPDAWETSFGLNPSAADANQDNDHDGIENLMEFALGMNPGLSDPQLLPKITLEGGYATLTVDRNVDASNLVFTPQMAATPGVWNSGPGIFTIIEDTPSRLKVRMIDPVSVRNRAFLRLAVTKP